MSKPKAEKAPKTGKSLADFRAAHDRSFIVPQKIRNALKQLGSGWEYESAFIKLAGISQSDIGQFRDDFAEHVVETKGHNAKRIWAGTKEFAAQLREMI